MEANQFAIFMRDFAHLCKQMELLVAQIERLANSNRDCSEMLACIAEHMTDMERDEREPQ